MAGWHLSKSDPRKVYDERHNAVCVCQTAEQAALIVTAVKTFHLRGETLPQKSYPPVEETQQAGLDTFEADPCCGPALAKLLRSGQLRETDQWHCPKCGLQWAARSVGPLRHWEASDPLVGVF